MKGLVIIIALFLSSCSSQTKSKGFIEQSLEEYADSLTNRKNITLNKTIYSSGSSEEKTFTAVDWNKEFSLFLKYNIQHAAKKGELVFDTILDQRTNRFLLRGMRLEQGPGLQSFYLVMDSLRQLMQFRIAETEESWLKKSEREVYWNRDGEYSYSSITEHTFSKDENIQILAEWK